MSNAIQILKDKAIASVRVSMTAAALPEDCLMSARLAVMKEIEAMLRERGFTTPLSEFKFTDDELRRTIV